MKKENIEKLLQKLKEWDQGQRAHIEDFVFSELSKAIANAAISHDYETLKLIEKELSSIHIKVRRGGNFYTGMIMSLASVTFAVCNSFDITAVKKEVAMIRNGRTVLSKIKSLIDEGKPLYSSVLKEKLIYSRLELHEISFAVRGLHEKGCISYPENDYTDKFPDDFQIALKPKGLLFFAD